jgi:hypothetical protein
MTLAIEVLAAWFFADFFSGLGHWFQDRVMTKPFKNQLLESIRLSNELHHDRPGAMLKYSWFENVNTTLVFTAPLAIALFLIGAPVVLWLAVFFLSFSNLIHRFSHTRKVNGFIKIGQGIGIFASFGHHFQHHFDKDGVIRKDDSTIRYCVMTDWVNPILDRIGFFDRLEKFLKVQRRTNV